MSNPQPQPGEVWDAPHANRPVNAEIFLPGSKSLTNRHLVLAALATAPSVISGVLESRDSDLMIQALTALGAKFDETGQPGQFRVTPLDVAAPGREITIDCGLAGTVMRFVPPVAALTNHTVFFTGDEESFVRPMGAVVDGLIQAGAKITASTNEPINALPFTVHGTGGLAGGEVAVDASGSSQFISALLLVAARCEHGLQVRHTGEHVPSPEHIGMTVAQLETSGVVVNQPDPARWDVAVQHIRTPDIAVEPDLSNAGPYVAAAVVTGGRVEIPHWPVKTTQIGDRWRQILPMFGASVEFDRQKNANFGTLIVTGQRDENGPVVTGGGEIADTAELAPSVCALALAAQGPTQVTRIGHLRGHETDRLTAITAEAAKLGVQITEGPDFLAFTGGTQLQPARLDSYADHRMATFAAILGLVTPGIRIADVATTAKTMPRFPRAWLQMVQAAEKTEVSDKPVRVQA